jgi:alpha-amylase
MCIALDKRVALWLALGALALASACYSPQPGAAGGRRITPGAEDWRDEVIYQIVVDRFADGDYSNNWRVDITGRRLSRYQGGDWQGVINKIPYLKELGVTTIWISPVVRNVETESGFDGYHGYWTQDFLEVNQHFGDIAKMQEMVDKLHDAGFKVILDIVTNHIGQLFYYDINANGKPDDMIFGGGGNPPGSDIDDIPGRFVRRSEWDPDYDRRTIQSFTSLGESGLADIRWVYMPEVNRVPVRPEIFQNADWYNKRGRVTVWENMPSVGDPSCQTATDNNPELCDYVREQEMLGDFPGGLKDLATTREDVRSALIQVFKYWITIGDFDGFRIDTLKHVEPEFWKTFCPAMRAHATSLGKQNFLMFGEAFTGADRLLGSYTKDGQVDSVFYFSQMYALKDVFWKNESTNKLRRLHEARVSSLYGSTPHAGGVGVPPNDLLVNFLDNHDVERFLSGRDLATLQNALVYLLTTIGVPCIYYGTEQEFDGGKDPKNREPMWLGNPGRGHQPYATTPPTFSHIKRLIEIRRQHRPLRRGDFTVRWPPDQQGAKEDWGIFAFERSVGGERVVVVINTRKCPADGSKPVLRTSFNGVPMATGFAATTEVKDELTGDRFVVGTGAGEGGSLDIELGCQSSRILVASGR